MDQKLLLVVDDNPDNRIVFTAALEHAGYRTLGAANGAEAVGLARHHQPDLILMDLRMPLMDGWEATRLLKEDPATSAIRVVALTAEIHPVPRLNAVGFCALIEKPVTLTALAAAVGICLASETDGAVWIKLPDYKASLAAGVTTVQPPSVA